jgi:tRNA nucleotidyltransferase/poly(A) polymerase
MTVSSMENEMTKLETTVPQERVIETMEKMFNAAKGEDLLDLMRACFLGAATLAIQRYPKERAIQLFEKTWNMVETSIRVEISQEKKS